jgi:hypothetical protein
VPLRLWRYGAQAVVLTREVERPMEQRVARKFRNGVHATARVRGQLELGRYEYVLPDEGENK